MNRFGYTCLETRESSDNQWRFVGPEYDGKHVGHQGCAWDAEWVAAAGRPVPDHLRHLLEEELARLDRLARAQEQEQFDQMERGRLA